MRRVAAHYGASALTILVGAAMAYASVDLVPDQLAESLAGSGLGRTNIMMMDGTQLASVVGLTVLNVIMMAGLLVFGVRYVFRGLIGLLNDVNDDEVVQEWADGREQFERDRKSARNNVSVSNDG